MRSIWVYCEKLSVVQRLVLLNRRTRRYDDGLRVDKSQRQFKEGALTH